jgi:hypothetical protein
MRRPSPHPFPLRSATISSRQELDGNEWAILALPEEHPVPWYYQEEMDGRPVSWHYREEHDAYTDNARRHHVVRDANGDVIINCAKFSKNEEEKLARAIASIPNRRTEITRLRARVAELESTVAELKAELCAALKAAATCAPAAQQKERSDEGRVAIAAKQIIEADFSLLEFAQLLARSADLGIDKGGFDTPAPGPHVVSCDGGPGY